MPQASDLSDVQIPRKHPAWAATLVILADNA
jgi:hypothetical protein